MGIKVETIEAIATTGKFSMYGGAGIGSVGAFIQSNLVGVIGVLIALAGFFVNTHFKRKSEKRQAEEHALRMEERRLRVEVLRDDIAKGRRPTPAPECVTEMEGA